MAIKDIYGERKKEKKLYSGYDTAVPHTQSTPQNSAWDTGQSTVQHAPRLQGDTYQKSKREKTPSELGEEVVRLMLEEEFPELRKSTAIETKGPAAAATAAPKAKAAAGNQKEVQYNSEASTLGGSAAAVPYSGGAVTPYDNITAAPYGRTDTLQNAKQHKQAFSFQPSTYDSVAAQLLANARPGENTLRDMQWSNGFSSALQTPRGKCDSIYTTSAWQPLAAVQYPATVRFDESDPDGSQYGDSIYGLDENGGSSDAISEEPRISMQDIATVGTGNYMLPATIWLGDQLKQLVEDTHIAEGMSVPLYWIERGVNGGERLLEGIWNYGVDVAEAREYAALEQSIQQSQQFAGWGGPWQQYAELMEGAMRPVQESLPNGAEFLRSHKAEEHLRQIEEAYDAGGVIKIVGDTVSGIGQMGLAGLINMGTGGWGGLPALAASASGNAATEMRAGGANDNVAHAYGNLVGLVEAGPELLSGGIPWLPKGLLDNVLADVAETNMGRVAWKAVQNALGEGAEEFISTMAEAYLAKLWNGDERGAWQTFEETFPDALYAAFQGATTSAIMCAPNNTSNIQYARALDAAIDVLNNGGTLTDAEIAAANASRQYLINNWGKDSKWSQNANGQWMSAWNKHFGVFFPPIGNLAPNAVDVQEPGIEIQDVETDVQNERAVQEGDETAPESEALLNEENYDMLSEQEKSDLGKAAALIPHIPSSLLDSDQQKELRFACRRILKFAAGIPRDAEVTMLFRMDMTPIKKNGIFVGEPGAGRVEYTAPNEPFISIHNHPDGRTFSEGDIKSFLESDEYKIMVAVGHNGKVYVLEKYEGFNSAAALDFYESAIDQYPNRIESAETYIAWMEEIMITGVEQYGASYYSR